jgi:hypothetical protein
MATIVTFKCQKCQEEFRLVYGLLNADLVDVREGMELPGGAKLPDKKTFAKLFKEKTFQRIEKFINQLDTHGMKCKGEVKLVSLVLAH